MKNNKPTKKTLFWKCKHALTKSIATHVTFWTIPWRWSLRWGFSGRRLTEERLPRSRNDKGIEWRTRKFPTTIAEPTGIRSTDCPMLVFHLEGGMD